MEDGTPRQRSGATPRSYGRDAGKEVTSQITPIARQRSAHPISSTAPNRPIRRQFAQLFPHPPSSTPSHPPRAQTLGSTHLVPSQPPSQLAPPATNSIFNLHPPTTLVAALPLPHDLDRSRRRDPRPPQPPHRPPDPSPVVNGDHAQPDERRYAQRRVEHPRRPDQRPGHFRDVVGRDVIHPYPGMTGDGSADGNAQEFVEIGIGVGGRDEEVGGDG